MSGGRVFVLRSGAAVDGVDPLQSSAIQTQIHLSVPLAGLIKH